MLLLKRLEELLAPRSRSPGTAKHREGPSLSLVDVPGRDLANSSTSFGMGTTNRHVHYERVVARCGRRGPLAGLCGRASTFFEAPAPALSADGPDPRRGVRDRCRERVCGA